MKGFIAGVVIGVGVSGGTLLANLPNPEVGECELADVIFTREEPTLIDPEGAVTGAHGWQVCGYQVPTGVGANVRAVDSQFYFEWDQDAAIMISEAAADLTADDVFLHD